MASRQARMAVARLQASWEIVEAEARACVDALVQVSVRLTALQSTKASPLLAKYASQREALTALLVKQFESNSMALHRCLDKYGAVARQMVRLFDDVDPLQTQEPVTSTSESGGKVVRSLDSAEFSQPIPTAVRAPSSPQVSVANAIPAAGAHPKLTLDALRDAMAVQDTQDLVRAYSCEHWRRVQLLQKLSKSRSASDVQQMASAWSAQSPDCYLPKSVRSTV
jgi:hypothetical protein